MADEMERAAQLEQLAHLKAMGEKAYDDMYDAYPPGSAAAYYSDAKECFYDAIGLARKTPGAHQGGVPQPVYVTFCSRTIENCFASRNLTVLTAFDAAQIAAGRKPLGCFHVRRDKLEARS